MITMVVDVANLATRMFYVLPGMSEPGEGSQKGAIYGFLSQVRKLRERFHADRCVFCFDSNSCKRKDFFPGYKHNPHNGGQGTKDKKFLRPQIAKLKDDILPRLGFSNVFEQAGYEADDLIAAVCRSYQVKRAVIVSSDKDLYQCLSFRPGKEILQYTFSGEPFGPERLLAEYGVRPDQWPDVKAVSGCDTDSVPGVPGVKEKTAAKYLLGTLSENSKAYRTIKVSKDRVARNKILVTLPWEGCEIPELREDRDSNSSWLRVTRDMKLQLR